MSTTETTEPAGEYSDCTTSYYPHYIARLLIKESNTFPFNILLDYGCVTVAKTPKSPAKGSTISLRSLFDALPKFCAGEMEMMCMDDELNDTFLVSDSDSVDFLPIHEEHTDCKLSIISRRDIFFILPHMVLSLQYVLPVPTYIR